MNQEENGAGNRPREKETEGVIIKGVGGLYQVSAEDLIFSCKPRGIFRKKKQTPMIGDRVFLSECDREACTAVIDEIAPRKNFLVRPAVANVDRILFVIAAEAPAPDLLLLDKMLASAVCKGIGTALIVNKKDQNEAAAERLLSQYRNAVDTVLAVSASKGEGIGELKQLVQGGISVLAGQSGVGKSSLLNCLVPERLAATGMLSEKLERGRHTTRHSEIFPLENGFLIDSPGFSLFELNGILPGDLQTFYPELYNNKGTCRYMNCSHTGEPDCFVAELLAKHLFDGGRYERYQLIYRDLKEKEKNKYR